MPFTLSSNPLISISSLKSLLSRSSSLRFLLLAMADNTTENSAETDAVKFGFERPEMYQKDLANTVDPYDRHVFLCYKTHDVWPPRVEASDSDPLPKRLAEALKARKNDISLKTRLTICEGRKETELADGDVLVFPDMVKYRGLKDADVDNFVEDVFVNGEPWDSGIQEGLKGSHVFVCAHNARDRRCGVCGPALIDKFKEEIELKGLQGQVFVSACSHVGGHKYAGNLIVFRVESDGKVSGHWYGYVVPADVSELLDKHIGEGEIIERIWRGQMGAVVIDTEKVDELKLSNGNDLNNDKEKQHEPEESKAEDKAAVESCCQGANGISCCQDGNLEEKRSLKETVTSCCQGANGTSCCSAGNSEEKQGKKALKRLTSWMGKWEQHEVLAAAGIVGAVATLAVACSLYKRSSEVRVEGLETLDYFNNLEQKERHTEQADALKL